MISRALSLISLFTPSAWDITYPPATSIFLRAVPGRSALIATPVFIVLLFYLKSVSCHSCNIATPQHPR